MARGKCHLPERPVVISFDDGYADNYDAVGLLLNRGLPSSVYVTTGAIGQAGRLSGASVAELARLPDVDVGAHAVNHRRLDELDEGNNGRSTLLRIRGREVRDLGEAC